MLGFVAASNSNSEKQHSRPGMETRVLDKKGQRAACSTFVYIYTMLFRDMFGHLCYLGFKGPLRLFGQGADRPTAGTKTRALVVWGGGGGGYSWFCVVQATTSETWKNRKNTVGWE